MRSSSRMYTMFPTIAVALLGAAACSDAPTAPLELAAIPARFSTDGGTGPKLRSNSVKYREQTVPHQSNRSGAATITSRALKGKDGSTVLEVTTGALDQAAASGNISKLQVKFLDPDGDHQATTNFNGLRGGSQQRSFDGLVRHSFIQTQANVRDIDPKRTDVVTVTERVNLRPDLTVRDVVAPARAKPNDEVIIVATVAELNGDVGATDDCVLYVNGVETRRVNGQWIADGDEVNCVFRTAFSQPGTYSLMVRSQNVVPADWDMANNSASRQIEIVSAEIVVHGWAQAAKFTRSEYGHYTGTWRSQDGLHHGEYERTWRNTGREQSIVFNAYGFAPGQQALTFPLSSVSVRVSSDGKSTDVVATSGLQANAGANNCGYMQPDWYHWFQVCSFSGFASVHGGFYGGSAVYFDYYFYEHTAPGYYHTTGWNQSGSRVLGNNGLATQVPFGDEVALSVRVEGGNGGVIVGNAVIALNQVYEWSGWNNHPLTCQRTTGGWTSEYCSEQSYTYSSRWGWVNF